MSPNKTNPQFTNFPGKPENVKKVSQERKQDVLALPDQEGKNAGPLTEVTSDSSARRIKRQEALAQRGEKYFTPSISERKGIDPSFTGQRSSKSRSKLVMAVAKLAEDEREQNQINALEAKINSLSSC